MGQGKVWQAFVLPLISSHVKGMEFKVGVLLLEPETAFSSFRAEGRVPLELATRPTGFDFCWESGAKGINCSVIIKWCFHIARALNALISPISLNRTTNNTGLPLSPTWSVYDFLTSFVLSLRDSIAQLG